MVMKTSDMHKRVFQGLKCTSMHVTDLTSPDFGTKLVYGNLVFLNQNMVDEDLKNAETRVYAFFTSSPPFLIEKKQFRKQLVFEIKIWWMKK